MRLVTCDLCGIEGKACGLGPHRNSGPCQVQATHNRMLKRGFCQTVGLHIVIQESGVEVLNAPTAFYKGFLKRRGKIRFAHWAPEAAVDMAFRTRRNILPSLSRTTRIKLIRSAAGLEPEDPSAVAEYVEARMKAELKSGG